MGFKTSTALANTTVPADSTESTPSEVLELSTNTLLATEHENKYLNVVDGCSTITLGAAAASLGATYHVHVDEGYTARSVTIDPNSSEVIGRRSTYLIGPSTYIKVRSNGVSWDVLAATYSSAANGDPLTIDLQEDDQFIMSPDDSGEHVGDHTCRLIDLSKSLNTSIGTNNFSGSFGAFGGRSYYSTPSSAGAYTIIASAVTYEGQTIKISVAEEADYPLEVRSQGSGSIESGVSYTLLAGGSVDLKSNGATWKIVSQSRMYVADSEDYDSWTRLPNTDLMSTLSGLTTDGSGTIVAISQGGTDRIMTSTDGGATFVVPVLPVVGAWTTIAYGYGIFVVFSNSTSANNLLTSSDGLNWVASSPSLVSSPVSVTFSGSGFVLLCDYDGFAYPVYTAQYGLSWSLSTTLDGTLTWTSLVGGGSVVAIAEFYSADAYSVAYSYDDGATFTLTDFPNAQGHFGLSYADSMFIATTAFGGGSHEISVSTDGGASWVSKGIPVAVTRSFAYAAPYLVGFGEPDIYYSTDSGDTWLTADTTPAGGPWEYAISDSGRVVGGSYNSPSGNLLISTEVLSSARGISSDGSQNFTENQVFEKGLTSQTPITVPTYLVADLPAGSIGHVAFTSDGRKNGEGVAAGTGVLVFFDSTNWVACDSGQAVLA